jgi:hypothetical protein
LIPSRFSLILPLFLCIFLVFSPFLLFRAYLFLSCL